MPTECERSHTSLMEHQSSPQKQPQTESQLETPTREQGTTNDDNSTRDSTMSVMEGKDLNGEMSTSQTSTTSSNGHSSNNSNGSGKKTPIISPDPTAYVAKARVTRPTPPPPSYNPMQFVQIKPCNLYQTAQEQLKKAEEVKRIKEVKKEEPEDWQNNLDNWKSSRRKRVEHIIDRVVEVKKLELEDHDRSRKKSKTLSEMIEQRGERNGRGLNKLNSLTVYNEDETNDLSDLGIGTSSASGKSSQSEDYDNNSVLSDNPDIDKAIFESNHKPGGVTREYISSPGYDTSSSTAPGSSPDPCEYTYEGAIQDYKQRVSRATAAANYKFAPTNSGKSKETTPERLNSNHNGNNNNSGSVPDTYPTRRGSKIEDRLIGFEVTSPSDSAEGAEKNKVDVPKIDISKRKEIFESQFVNNEPKSVGSNGGGAAAVPRVTLRDRFAATGKSTDSNEPIDTTLKREVKRLSGDITSVRDRLQSLEQQQQQNSVNATGGGGTKMVDIPVPPLKDRLSSLQNAVTKEEVKKAPVALVDARQLEIMKNEEENAKKQIVQQTEKGEKTAGDAVDSKAATATTTTPHSAGEMIRIEVDRDDSGIHTSDDIDAEEPHATNKMQKEQEQQLNAAIAALAMEEKQLEEAANAVNQIEAEFAELSSTASAALPNLLSATNEQPCEMEFSINEALELALEAIDNESHIHPSHPVKMELTKMTKISSATITTTTTTTSALQIIENRNRADTTTNKTDEEKELKCQTQPSINEDHNNHNNNNYNNNNNDNDDNDNDNNVNDDNEAIISQEPIYENISPASGPNSDAEAKIIPITTALNHSDHSTHQNHHNHHNDNMITNNISNNNNINVNVNTMADLTNAFANNTKITETIKSETSTPTQGLPVKFPASSPSSHDRHQRPEPSPQRSSASASASSSATTAITTSPPSTVPSNLKVDPEPYYQVPKSSEPYYDAPKHLRPIPVYENIEIFFNGMESSLLATPNGMGFKMEPPKEKPPPPPTESPPPFDDVDSMSFDNNTDTWSSDNTYETISSRLPLNQLLAVEHPSPPIKRMNSTKRIKKELRNKRSSFLGIEGSSLDDDETYLELTVAPPPDMAQLLQEERRLEKQLYMKAGLCDSSDTGESRDSGVSENHSRQSSEHYTNSSEENDRHVESPPHSLKSNEVIYSNEALSLTAAQTPLLQTVKGNSAESWTESATVAAAATKSLTEATATANAKMLSIEEKIREQEEVLRVERELLQLEQEELKRQRENLMLRENMARRELQHGAKMLMSANRRSLQDLNGLGMGLSIAAVATASAAAAAGTGNIYQTPMTQHMAPQEYRQQLPLTQAVPVPQQNIYANIPNLQQQYYQVETDYRKSMSDLNEFSKRLMMPPPTPPTKPMRSMHMAPTNGHDEFAARQRHSLNSQSYGGSLVKIATPASAAVPRTPIYSNFQHQPAPIVGNGTAATVNAQGQSLATMQTPSQTPIAVVGSHVHPGNMTRNTLHALSATPKPKYTDGWVQVQNRKSYDTNLANDPAWLSAYQQKRKSMPESYHAYNGNANHWLVQEAEQRRISEQQRRSASTGNTPVHQHQQQNGALKNGGIGTANTNGKPLPDAIIQTLTERVQSKGIGERKRFDNYNNNNNNIDKSPLHTAASYHQQPKHTTIAHRHLNELNALNSKNSSVAIINTTTSTPPITSSNVATTNAIATTQDNSNNKVLSVSGKKKCSHCGDELGRGAAMIIESLLLFYHINCFKCCVCHVQLGDGLNGTDVRVRNHKLHCQNCYSSDDGIKFSCV